MLERKNINFFYKKKNAIQGLSKKARLTGLTTDIRYIKDVKEGKKQQNKKKQRKKQ